MSESPCQSGDGPIRSLMADDPDMLELVEFFVERLDDQVAEICAALAANDLKQLKTLSHQLKGAAGGYGFPGIGELAAGVEAALLATNQSEEVIRARVEQLTEACRRVCT